jgi:hypothetical protein
MASHGAHGLTCRRSLLLQEESDVELTCRRSSACFFIKLCYLYKKHTANQSKCGNPKNLKAKEKERSKEGKFILLGVRYKVKEREVLFS